MSVAPIVEKYSLPVNRDNEILGALLIELGKISEHDINTIAAHQNEQGTRFGEAAVALGLITSDELFQALSKQFDYPCILSGADPSELSSKLVSAYKPFGFDAEKYRALRTNLLLQSFSEEKKLLTIVPTENVEKMAIMASNLAISFAQTGKRILLIDTDMRTPQLHRLFNIKSSPGISDVLIGRIPLKKAVAQASVAPTLSILTAGATPPNPQELLSRPIFSSLLEVVSRIYDLVIITTCSADKYSDPIIVASRTHNCIFSIMRNSEKFENVDRTKKIFIDSGIEIIGAALCD